MKTYEEALKYAKDRVYLVIPKDQVTVSIMCYITMIGQIFEKEYSVVHQDFNNLPDPRHEVFPNRYTNYK